jgi:hypothetical protein
MYGSNPVTRLEADYQSGINVTRYINGVAYSVRVGSIIGKWYLSQANFTALGNKNSVAFCRVSATQYILPYPKVRVVDSGTKVSGTVTWNWKVFSDNTVEMDFLDTAAFNADSSRTYTLPFALANTNYNLQASSRTSKTTGSSVYDGFDYGLNTTAITTTSFLLIADDVSNSTGVMGQIKGTTSLLYPIPNTYYQLSDSTISTPEQLTAAGVVNNINKVINFLNLQFPGWST